MIKRYSRGLFALGAVGLAAALAGGGCAFTRSRSEPSVLVIWSNPTGMEEQAFKVICERFEREHPGIKVVNTGNVDETRLTRAVIAGAAPDLAYLYQPVAAGEYAANHAIMPLDDFFTRSHLSESDLLPGAIPQCRFQGRLVAMPMTRDSRALYWNRACFRRAGLDPDRPPRTLEEVMKLAVRLTHRDPNSQAITQLGILPPNDDPDVLFGIFGGGSIDLKTGRITANRPENVRALRWLVDLTDAEGGMSAVATLTSGFGSDSSSQNPLATGKIAMRIDGEYAAMHLDRFAPGTDYALGEVPYPADRPDLKNMAWGDGDILLIPSGSHHPELAWEFIRWMQLPAQQITYARSLANLPTLSGLADDPRFSAGSRSMAALGYVLRHIATNKNNSRFMPPSPVSQMYVSALKNAFDTALYHNKTPEQALADVQKRIEREWARYR